MRELSWLYEQIGRLQIENLMLKEELAKLQQAVPIPAPPETK